MLPPSVTTYDPKVTVKDFSAKEDAIRKPSALKIPDLEPTPVVDLSPSAVDQRVRTSPDKGKGKRKGKDPSKSKGKGKKQHWGKKDKKGKKETPKAVPAAKPAVEDKSAARSIFLSPGRELPVPPAAPKKGMTRTQRRLNQKKKRAASGQTGSGAGEGAVVDYQ